MNVSKSPHRSIAGIFALAMIVLGCTFLGLEDTGTTGAEKDGHFPIDLDEDGTIDFALERPRPHGHENVAVHTVKIVPRRDNEIVQGGNGFVRAFDRGDLIGGSLPDTLEWASEAPYLYHFIYHSYPDSSFVQWRGPWPSEQDRYLGLKLVRGGEAYYGWTHVHVDTSSENVKVRGYGYNSSPGQAIQAGQE